MTQKKAFIAILLGAMLSSCLEGPAGKDGVDGAPGAPGTDGKSGLNGKDGAQGKDGIDGTSVGIDSIVGTLSASLKNTQANPYNWMIKDDRITDRAIVQVYVNLISLGWRQPKWFFGVTPDRIFIENSSDLYSGFALDNARFKILIIGP